MERSVGNFLRESERRIRLKYHQRASETENRRWKREGKTYVCIGSLSKSPIGNDTFPFRKDGGAISRNVLERRRRGTRRCSALKKQERQIRQIRYRSNMNPRRREKGDGVGLFRGTNVDDRESCHRTFGCQGGKKNGSLKVRGDFRRVKRRPYLLVVY